MRPAHLAALALALVFIPGFAEAADWRERLKPEAPGPFPVVRPFDATYRFGWSDIEAARADVTVRHEGEKVIVKAEGGTKGLARPLYQLDARHQAELLIPGLQSLWFHQKEDYAKRSITTDAAFKEKGLWRMRRVSTDPPEKAKWKKISVKPIRDMVAAMFFIRSQSLADGDKVGVIAFPGDSAYFVEVTVTGRETLLVKGTEWKAIKLQLDLHKIAMDGPSKGSLESHKKFRSGTVWLSDDENRIPLRAEVNIFIGYVFGELDTISFK